MLSATAIAVANGLSGYCDTIFAQVGIYRMYSNIGLKSPNFSSSNNVICDASISNIQCNKRKQIHIYLENEI